MENLDPNWGSEEMRGHFLEAADQQRITSGSTRLPELLLPSTASLQPGPELRRGSVASQLHGAANIKCVTVTKSHKIHGLRFLRSFQWKLRLEDKLEFLNVVHNTFQHAAICIHY